MAQASVLYLTPTLSQIPLFTYLQWSPSTSVDSDLETVLNTTDWKPVNTNLLNQRLLGTSWYRIEVENNTAANTSWHLVIDAIRVDEVKLYTYRAGQEWSEQKAGGRVHRSVWPLQTRIPTFVLNLEPGKHIFFLRVKGPQHWFLEMAEIRSVPFNLGGLKSEVQHPHQG